LSDPDDPRIRFNVGDALYRRQEFDKALEEFRKAAGTGGAPLDASTWFNMGNTLYRMGKLPESIQAYRRALQFDPDDMDAKHNLEFVRRRLEKNAQQQPGDDSNRENEADRKESPPPRSGGPEEGRERESDPGKGPDREEPDPERESRSDPVASADTGDKPPEPRDAREGEPMSPEEAARLLNALRNEEKNIQMKRKKTAAGSKRIKKDWSPE